MQKDNSFEDTLLSFTRFLYWLFVLIWQCSEPVLSIRWVDKACTRLQSDPRIHLCSKRKCSGLNISQEAIFSFVSAYTLWWNVYFIWNSKTAKTRALCALGLIVYCLTSIFRFLHAYWDVAIADERLQNKAYIWPGRDPYRDIQPFIRKTASFSRLL
jgi:hypothetical protein